MMMQDDDIFNIAILMCSHKLSTYVDVTYTYVDVIK